MGESMVYMKILEQFKSQEAKLAPAEKDKLRTELLSYLLFDNARNNSENSNRAITGLSEEEKELIKKLAARTEALHRLMNDEDQ